MKLILIGCGKTKHPLPQPAADLYVGNLFKARRRYAEDIGGPWAILSAKHGLLTPDNVTPPYDLVIIQLAKAERLSWAKSVWQDVRARWPELSQVEVHAGKDYVNPLIETQPDSIHIVEHPVRGMGIGQQLGFYSNLRR